MNGSIRVGGAVLFHSLGEWTSRQALAENLEKLGLEKFTPDPRTEPSVLNDALGEVFAGPAWEISRLKNRECFEVMELRKGEWPTPNTRTLRLLCRVQGRNGDTRIECSPLVEESTRIGDAYNRHLGLLTTAQVSASLVALLQHLGGTSLRPKGSIYWLPNAALPRWEDIRIAVTGAAVGNQHKLYIIRHDLDMDAMLAVRDAIVAEVAGEARLIQQAVDEGGLGERALRNRVDQAERLLDKVGEYESLLDTGLKSLHDVVEAAKQAAAGAAILACVTAAE